LPANLTPQYYAAEERYKKAQTHSEKIEALQEMMAVIPKHKGTEKLQGDIKKKLSQLREEGQKKKQKGGFNPFNVEKQGAGQVVLAGYPNTGKSALVAALTRAKVKVADFPYTTILPATGMMAYEDTLTQLVDTPPITADSIPPGLMGTFRNADALLLVIDLSDENCLEQLEVTAGIMIEHGIIDPTSDNESFTPYLVFGLKSDMANAPSHLKILRELNPEIDILPISIHGNLDSLRQIIFQLLGVIRIYGKSPGKPADMEKPFILKHGSTVTELAYKVHRDFPGRLKNALVWGSARFDGQAVPHDYVLHDKDIVELIV